MKKKIVLIIGVVLVLLGISLAIFGGKTAVPVLTGEKRNELEAFWEVEYGMKGQWFDPENPEKYSSTRYYGNYNGYDVIFDQGITCSQGILTVGREEFKHTYDFRLLAYKDGVLIDLYSAYADGLISGRDIRKIAKIHEQCQVAILGSQWEEYFT